MIFCIKIFQIHYIPIHDKLKYDNTLDFFNEQILNYYAEILIEKEQRKKKDQKIKNDNIQPDNTKL